MDMSIYVLCIRTRTRMRMRMRTWKKYPGEVSCPVLPLLIYRLAFYAQ